MSDRRPNNDEMLYFPTSARPAIIRLAILAVVLIFFCVYVWFLPEAEDSPTPAPPAEQGFNSPRQ